MTPIEWILSKGWQPLEIDSHIFYIDPLTKTVTDLTTAMAAQHFRESRQAEEDQSSKLDG